METMTSRITYYRGRYYSTYVLRVPQGIPHTVRVTYIRLPKELFGQMYWWGAAVTRWSSFRWDTGNA